jgi:hypothetical protein
MGAVASGAARSSHATSAAPSGSTRRSLGCTERHPHAPAAGRPRTAFAWRAVVEGCGVAPDGAAARRLRGVGAVGLGELRIRYLFLDGWYPRMRIGKKRVRVPVLVMLGVCADGRRVVLDLRLAGVESEQAWLDAVRSLAARNLGAPRLVASSNRTHPLRWGRTQRTLQFLIDDGLDGRPNPLPHLLLERPFSTHQTPAIALHGIILRHPPPSGREWAQLAGSWRLLTFSTNFARHYRRWPTKTQL